ncbi:MAG: hypothetical protein KAQ98_02425 [Bacteriovoracaceae bacterium]|nr:hypothetical protein [Bacteriovoracaceae bacterium]
MKNTGSMRRHISCHVGASLLQVIVIGGILAASAIYMLQLQKDQIAQQKRAFQNITIDNTTNRITQFLKNRAACTNSLTVGVPPRSGLSVTTSSYQLDNDGFTVEKLSDESGTASTTFIPNLPTVFQSGGATVWLIKMTVVHFGGEPFDNNKVLEVDPGNSFQDIYSPNHYYSIAKLRLAYTLIDPVRYNTIEKRIEKTRTTGITHHDIARDIPLTMIAYKSGGNYYANECFIQDDDEQDYLKNFCENNVNDGKWDKTIGRCYFYSGSERGIRLDATSPKVQTNWPELKVDTSAGSCYELDDPNNLVCGYGDVMVEYNTGPKIKCCDLKLDWN